MASFEWRVESRESFYSTLVEWWGQWNFPILPQRSLPERIFVVSRKVTENDYIDLYAIPVFLTDSSQVWIGFPTGNKTATVEQKQGALDFIMDKIETSVKYHGFDSIITTSMTPKLMELFESRGFIVSDQGTNFYTKNL